MNVTEHRQAKNSDLSSRSAEKDRRESKTSGPIGCSPESVINKQHQAYDTPEEFPEISSDLANRKNASTVTVYTHQSVQSPPQLYYTAHPIQDGASYRSVKREPHNDPP